ncbi:MAG TPA: transglycosylase SLT domain-containing protein [Vicinamibacteria bacterium]|nr:transglycosylase SLT domain-containing protein [Vicinamibacteria bacterium]
MLRCCVLSAALLVASAVPAGARYWIAPDPKDASEAAIREALSRSAFAGPEAIAAALNAIADAAPGSRAAALARLAAGLELVDADKPDAALAALRHDEVAAADLPDYALFGVARALEAKKDKGAGAAYVAAADARADGPLFCAALGRGSELLAESGDTAGALRALERCVEGCAERRASSLLALGRLHEKARSLKSAAEAYDRLDREYPASAQARSVEKTLRALATYLQPEDPAARDARSLAKAVALLESGQAREALAILRALHGRPLAGGDADRVRTKLGRAYLALKRPKDAEAELRAVPADSPHGGEAAFYRARAVAARTSRPDAYEDVATAFAGAPWGEEALLSLANHYQKDARDDEALPYYRRLLEGYPDGRHFDRAGWRVGWGEFRAGDYAAAATTLERVARLKPKSGYAGGMLYWAGRAKAGLGDTPGARALLQEVVVRYKNSYHGLRAQEALQRLPRGPALDAASVVPLREAGALPEADVARVERLLLIGRLDAAHDELRRLPQEPLVQATLAFIDHRRGRLRPAMVSMRRAYPDWISERGSRLPEEVWRILYPLEFDQLLRQKAAEESLDASLVAGLICQESTFDPGAVSPAGARGLMQVIPPTGRALARELRVRYRSSDLLSPTTSLDFGTRYLRQLFDRFGGRVELALAAYNAGPHRVDAWTAGRPDMPEEEFVESIPFTETRHYVMTVLASREQYRRLYGLGPSAAGSTATAGGR